MCIYIYIYIWYIYIYGIYIYYIYMYGIYTYMKQWFVAAFQFHMETWPETRVKLEPTTLC